MGQATMIEVVGMVYKGGEYARLLWSQMDAIPRPGYLRIIIANDADDACITSLEGMGANWTAYNDPDPADHYLARVYRCWNYCVESSNAEYVCLVNSDMVFSRGWLEALERRLDGKTLPVSRLVEPGFLRPGQHAIEIDLGRDPVNFPFDSWEMMASDLSQARTEPGGLFMPCILNREAFLRVGGYPHGNVNGRSGDAILFEKMAEAGFQHVTCFDSLVYHFQEGEMRS